jgi:glyoxylase-like metal-dependent hydrolase (beta-lactamase superfamily II)
MIVESRAVGPFFKNGFLVACERSREAVVIDPGDEVAELIALAVQDRLDVRAILLTHAHIDHVTGVRAAKQAFAVPIYLHHADLFLYEAAPEQARMFGLPVPDVPPIDRYFEEGAAVEFGELAAVPSHTPGHCPGGVCLAIGPRDATPQLFVGDTLFAGSIGRTDLPGGNHDTLLDSIRRVLFAFPDGTIVHPGHGPSTTIGRERRTNPFLT